MSVTCTYTNYVSVVEKLDGVFINPSDATVTADGLNKRVVLNETSTPPVSKQTAYQLPLVAGVGTIDLTVLPWVKPGVTIDGTGLHVQVIKLRNNAINTHPITVKVGAATGYQLRGPNYEEELQPGQEVTFYGNDLTPVVGAGAKILDVTGTGTDVLDVQINFG